MALSAGGIPAVGLTFGFTLAWDFLLLSHSATDIEHFSGVSAGSIPGAYLASGISPIEAVQVHLGMPGKVKPFQRQHLYVPNLDGLGGALQLLPRMAALFGRSLGRRDLEAAFTALRSVLPSSILVSRRLGALVRENLQPRCGDHFDRLARRLSIRAFDARSGRPLMCGQGGDMEVPVSQAVVASLTIPTVFDPVRMKVNGGDVLALDGMVAGAAFELATFGTRDVVIILDAMPASRTARDQVDLLEAAQLALMHVFQSINRKEISEFVNHHRTTHILYFALGDIPDMSSMSFAASTNGLRLGFERARDQIAAQFDYIDFIFRPRGVVLNPEIGRLGFDEAIRGGQALKASLLRKYAPASAPAAAQAVRQ
jgi:hypothetical protein